MTTIWIIGGGGHAKVVIDAARSSGAFAVAGILDDDERAWGTERGGPLVAGPIAPETLRRLGVTHAVIAIGNNRVREAIAARLDGMVDWATVVHARAYVAAGATLGPGTVVCAGAIVQPDARIGRHAIVNTAASVDHDCELGDCVHVAPGAHLAGNVTLGEGAFVGIGASVIPGRAVGRWATVGAGAAVIADVPDFATAVGVPARARSAQAATIPDM